MTTPRMSRLAVLGAMAIAVLLAASCASTPPIEDHPAPDDPELRDRLDQLRWRTVADVARVSSSMPGPVLGVYDLPYKFDAGGERHRDTLTRFSPAPQGRSRFGQPLNAWRTSDLT
jgi:hypothetical protein